ncbi:hypothetical protein GLAREA_10363 [Glarea lozoyensis ATCC 20868]|uniref:Uncharacterized protein n=1 Tax=Glarea lozoyensis (strain ATCC 20868 / MF5171) TaxID=1116229 RepID=S3DC45_GLAL2|nr:uncharacterized protein GLAREA_10363 [Glarea lozoyensis ATCC 20868]EPE34669.1 hypothetical protein GLAREA_10363 [Glarea lozoyensis ATCC 20868]
MVKQRRHEQRGRPLIWIARGTGVLVAKSAMLSCERWGRKLEDAVVSTLGVVFVGERGEVEGLGWSGRRRWRGFLGSVAEMGRGVEERWEELVGRRRGVRVALLMDRGGGEVVREVGWGGSGRDLDVMYERVLEEVECLRGLKPSPTS